MENYLKYFHTIFYLFITTIAEEKLSLLDNLLLLKGSKEERPHCIYRIYIYIMYNVSVIMKIST